MKPKRISDERLIELIVAVTTRWQLHGFSNDHDLIAALHELQEVRKTLREKKRD